MAIFKFKDRAKRQKSQALHESGLLAAEEAWFYSEEVRPSYRMSEASHAYNKHVSTLGGTPYALEDFKKKFRKRMKKAGFTV